MAGGGKENGAWTATFLAITIGLLGALIIWVVTPYNNFVLGNNPVSDSQLPILGVALILLLALVINPILRGCKTRFALDARQLGLASAIMLIASVIPSGGALQRLPYATTLIPIMVTDSQKQADAFARADLPPSLFCDPLAYGRTATNANHFINGLPADAEIPWRAWTGPLLAWGSLLLAGWTMMIGLSLLVLPQWRNNERLAFPLLGLQQALIEDPEKDKWFAPIFRAKSFWIAAGGVFALHLLAGLHAYHPTRVPAMPLSWSLNPLFASEPLVYLPGNIKASHIYFLLLGFTYFIPNRVSFSIWFVHLIYAVYAVVGQAYLPPYHSGTIVDHRMGATILLAITILWLGRAHWRRVAKAMVSRSASEEDARDRRAGWMFCLGFTGLFTWLLWAGVQAPWAVYFVIFIFVISLVINRVLAETGLPFVHVQTSAGDLAYVKLAGIGIITPAAIFFNGVLGILFVLTSHVNVAGMSSHALALDGKSPPRRQWRLAYGFIIVLAAGLLICGAVHLIANHHPHPEWAGSNQASIKNDGINTFTTYTSPSTSLAQYVEATAEIANGKPGQLDVPLYNRYAHLGFGFGCAGILQWLCLKIPTWPIHPIGVLLAETTFVQNGWVSILFGWFIKIGILRIGGAALYRSARPFFIGLIMGELFAAIFWGLTPLLLIALDKPFIAVPVLP
jgi:hypothetical protein